MSLAYTFKHEVAHASAYTPATASDLAFFQRSGTYPPPANINGNGNNQSLHAMASILVMTTKRAFDPYKAKAISLVKGGQDKDDRSKTLDE